MSIIDVEVVSHGNDLGQAKQQGRNRMLSEAGQSLQVEYRLHAESAIEAKRIQDILDNPKELARILASFKEVLNEKELASGRPLLIKEVSPAPIAPSSTLTTTRQEERTIRTEAAKEKGGYVNAIVVGVVAAVVGCLSLGCLARFLLATCRRGRDFPEQSSADEEDREDLEAGPGQQGENPEMYPTLLKITSQFCKNNTEMKPRSPLQKKKDIAVSITSLSTADLSTASNTSVSTGADIFSSTVKPEVDKQDSGSFSESSNTSVSTVGADIPVNVDTEDSGSLSEFEVAAVALPLPASQENHISMIQHLQPHVEMQGSIDLSELKVVLPLPALPVSSI